MTIVGSHLATSRSTRIATVVHRLDHTYGPKRWRSHRPPLDELVMTVLSQHTSDTNTARAYAELCRRFPDWQAVRLAATSDIADAIRSGGLANVKASRIRRILEAVERNDAPNLDSLHTMSTEAGRTWLRQLPGVGPKTAACVLLFSLGRPALPVDTHVHRVTRRLGLIGPTVTPEHAHDHLEPALGGDRDRVYAFHLNLIAHGRNICTARRPFCERCALTDCCDYYTDHNRSDPSHPPAPAPSSGRGHHPLPDSARPDRQ